jgi:hypothetical protein
MIGGWRKLLALGLWLGSSATAAAADDGAASSSPAIVGGVPSDERGDAVVMLVHPLGGSRATECSGTMLAPNLVLTARHCVVQTASIVDCSRGGGSPSTPFEPSSILVFGGRTRPTSDDVASAARGKELLFEPSPTLCDDDLALVLLDRAVANATIAPVRLASQPRQGELVTLVGWGSTGGTDLPDVKQQRADVPIVAIESPAEFIVGEGPCEGDSGGPALSDSGAVIGVLSRGDVDGCTNTTSVYTAAAAFDSLIRSAYARAGQEPWLEGQPNPTEAKPSSDDGGCSVTRRSSSSAPALALLVVGVALCIRRARARGGALSFARAARPLPARRAAAVARAVPRSGADPLAGGGRDRLRLHPGNAAARVSQRHLPLAAR